MGLIQQLSEYSLILEPEKNEFGIYKDQFNTHFFTDTLFNLVAIFTTFI
jgi:hypothetical protein